MRLANFLFAVCILFSLQSCEFNCSVGNTEKGEKHAVKIKDGARIYNNIELKTNKIKIDKAYLFLDSGERVPDDNFVDFKDEFCIRVSAKLCSLYYCLEQSGMYDSFI